MANPSRIIERARAARRYRQKRSTHQLAPEMEPLAPPMPTNHAGYTRLMQSHDRVRTRHLSKMQPVGIPCPKGGMDHD